MQGLHLPTPDLPLRLVAREPSFLPHLRLVHSLHFRRDRLCHLHLPRTRSSQFILHPYFLPRHLLCLRSPLQPHHLPHHPYRLLCPHHPLILRLRSLHNHLPSSTSLRKQNTRSEINRTHFDTFCHYLAHRSPPLPLVVQLVVSHLSPQLCAAYCTCELEYEIDIVLKTQKISSTNLSIITENAMNLCHLTIPTRIRNCTLPPRTRPQ